MSHAQYLIELRGLADWQSRLGDPDRHWKRRYSAMELAIVWANSRTNPRGLPPAVGAMLDSVPTLAGSRLVLAIPERRTALPGGNTASQSDLWGLLQRPDGRISLGVEGKAREPFGSLVNDWLAAGSANSDGSAGRTARLDYLCSKLGLTREAVQPLRYQLLHRTVATLIEAERWQAMAAVLLIQRFTAEPNGALAESWPDFAAFAHALGVMATAGQFQKAAIPGPIGLHLGWLDSGLATDAEIAAAAG